MASRTPVVTQSVIWTYEPEPSLIGTTQGVIWVVAGPFFHHPLVALCMAQPPHGGQPAGGIYPGSIMGFKATCFPQDAVIVTGHMMPNTDVQPDNEQKFHIDVINEVIRLRQIMGADAPVIFVGFSEGGIELSDTARHAANQFGWDRQVLVLASSPFSSRYLRQPQRAMVTGSPLLHASLGVGLSSRYGKTVAVGEIRLLRQEWHGARSELDLLVPLIEWSAANSGSALQCAQVIARQGGFGHLIDTGGHVVVITLPDDVDEVVKVNDNLRATRRSYDLEDDHVVTVHGHSHGLVFADAALYRAALAQPAADGASIRQYYAPQWGLS